MKLEVYRAFISAGVKEEIAKEAVESINTAIDRRYNLHAENLATKGDLAELEARLLKSINEFQKWSLTITVSTMAFLVAVIKLF